MRPEFELCAVDVNRAASNFSKQNVAGSGAEFAERKTHRRAAVAAASRLMKQQGAVFFSEPADQRYGLFCRNDCARPSNRSYR